MEGNQNVRPKMLPMTAQELLEIIASLSSFLHSRICDGTSLHIDLKIRVILVSSKHVRDQTCHYPITFQIEYTYSRSIYLPPVLRGAICG